MDRVAPTFLLGKWWVFPLCLPFYIWGVESNMEQALSIWRSVESNNYEANQRLVEYFWSAACKGTMNDQDRGPLVVHVCFSASMRMPCCSIFDKGGWMVVCPAVSVAVCCPAMHAWYWLNGTIKGRDRDRDREREKEKDGCVVFFSMFFLGYFWTETWSSKNLSGWLADETWPLPPIPLAALADRREVARRRPIKFRTAVVPDNLDIFGELKSCKNMKQNNQQSSFTVHFHVFGPKSY